MKQTLALIGLTLLIAFSGVLFAGGEKFGREEALENWVDSYTCINQCEEKKACTKLSPQSKRTACSEDCLDICQTIELEKEKEK